MAPSGAFKRAETYFRNFITKDGSSGFPAVADRYWLYVSLACPWACRTLAVRKLKGLEHVIGVTVVASVFRPTRPGLDNHTGWYFVENEGEEPFTSPDPINGAKFVRDLYEIADPVAASMGRFSVPVLWDKEKKTIVNNESSEIIRMLNFEYNHLAKNPSLDLYPEKLRPSIDEVNDWVYNNINNGVYKCGFSSTQAAYDQAVASLFESLDRAEEILSRQRYIAGSVLTEADIRLFVTLIRFDEVYTVHFKCNKKLIREYPNLFNYTKEIYQVPGISDTVDFFHINNHYYRSHSINVFGIVPVGSLSWVKFDGPNDRNLKFPDS
eukprot:TRINITY_DN13373_c0_g1_i1.p1 TRINITY_DN13373_c0_g1~~TRINITY_DN13373_c0_g1_i1.p1  ORF type:complete len:324 (+),score=74.52 TRINITY_DN13373_c0_g1_i1:182-1153(+)